MQKEILLVCCAFSLLLMAAFMLWQSRNATPRRRDSATVVHLPGPEYEGVHIYAVSTTLDKPELHRLGRSVARAGASLRVLFLPDTPIGRMPVGFGARIVGLLRALRETDDELICVVDAFDVLMTGDVRTLVEEYRKMVADRPPTLVFGAESGDLLSSPGRRLRQTVVLAHRSPVRNVLSFVCRCRLP